MTSMKYSMKGHTHSAIPLYWEVQAGLALLSDSNYWTRSSPADSAEVTGSLLSDSELFQAAHRQPWIIWMVSIEHSVSETLEKGLRFALSLDSDMCLASEVILQWCVCCPVSSIQACATMSKAPVTYTKCFSIMKEHNQHYSVYGLTVHLDAKALCYAAFSKWIY